MSNPEFIKLYEDDWPFRWSTLNASVWRYWLKLGPRTETNPNVLYLHRRQNHVLLVRSQDLETEVTVFNFYLVQGEFHLHSGAIAIHSLIDEHSRVTLFLVKPQPTYQMSEVQIKAIDEIMHHQEEFVLTSFNNLVHALATLTSNAERFNKVFLHSSNAILQVIHNVGLQFTRLPSTYQGKEEEDLRDYLLLFTEPLFQGTATGESVNRKGKTDILFRSNQINILVVECKFWSGSKKLQETIDQLLGNISTHDERAVIILFVREMNLSNIIQKAKNSIPLHQRYVQASNHQAETWLEYIFHHENDNERLLKLAFLLFHLP